ncbi:NUDIX domain-containing protein [Halogranum gelatinilyticum]|uniref:NUDIX domain-containing protein n=1 Tax=Halogranum gelatinilyticum TaxID=660521 RepID=A0A1G9USP7_9EURY|nr:NUDIX domain-containing protein [Halogranum gelatinilyticum]SDM62939.1 NUDIX domain-containing protein [Halogranum gelatinilyticum]
MSLQQPTLVPKACAYITRNGGRELLVFHGPGHDGLQIPKGTVEPDESPRRAVYREVTEESGLTDLGRPEPVAADVWKRRRARLYLRHFYHFAVEEPRDTWTHVVTGTGEEVGDRFHFFWVDLPTDEPFALGLDDYLSRLD